MFFGLMRVKMGRLRRSSNVMFCMVSILLVACTPVRESVGEVGSSAVADTAVIVLAQGVKADRVLVLKAARELHLYKNDVLLKKYHVNLGFNPIGDKVQEGDGRTPEGQYIIVWRNPKSAAYRSLHISYPNQSDIQAAKKLGVSPGGDIMIHGLYNGWDNTDIPRIQPDWTYGCVAVSNAEMDELWRVVDDGTPIEIRP
jgi:murein L,D-transpeptidase YafK